MHVEYKFVFYCFLCAIWVTIVGTGIYFYHEAQNANKEVMVSLDEQQSVLTDDSEQELHESYIKGIDVINLIQKYQKQCTVGLSTATLSRVYTEFNPFIKNMPYNLDYIEPEAEYYCYFDTNYSGVIEGIYFTIKSLVTDKDNPFIMKGTAGTTQFVMFTESSESFIVPQGITSASLYACASGKGQNAGSFIVSETMPVINEQSSGVTYSGDIGVRGGDIITCNLSYKGNTVISVKHSDGSLGQITLEAGTITPAMDNSVQSHTNILGFATVVKTGAKGADGYIDCIRALSASSDLDGMGGAGGAGGAFGFGGGGGQGASMDTYDNAYDGNGDGMEDSYTIAGSAAAGGSSTGINEGQSTKYMVTAIGGKGSDGVDRWDKTINLMGNSGNPGTLYYAGSGGASSDLTVSSSATAGPLDGYSGSVLKYYSRITGAGGGGGAGGYGAGGGEGGHGLEDTREVIAFFNSAENEIAYRKLYKSSELVNSELREEDATTNNYKTIYTYKTFAGLTVSKAADGAPTGGMVFLRFR